MVEGVVRVGMCMRVRGMKGDSVVDSFAHMSVCALHVHCGVNQADLTHEGAEEIYVKFHRISEFASPLAAAGTSAAATTPTPTHKPVASAGTLPAAVARLPDEP